MKEIIIIENIDKKLRAKRSTKDSVFPLSPTHRRELRQLRDRNLNDVRSRLRVISNIKKEEFSKKYKDKIQKKADEIEEPIKVMNRKFISIVSNVTREINQLKNMESKVDMTYVTIKSCYDGVSQLKSSISDYERRYSINDKSIKKALESLFESKFGDVFKKAGMKIDKMMEQYEEAINFGDLELVKELYYGMKDANKFLDSVSNLKV